MKTILTLSSVESGFSFGAMNDNGDAKYDFAKTIIDAVRTALDFQIGRVAPTPKGICTQPQLQLAKGDSGWAITKPMGIGAKILDVLPLSATSDQLAAAIAYAMSTEPAHDHDEPAESTVAARTSVN